MPYLRVLDSGTVKFGFVRKGSPKLYYTTDGTEPTTSSPSLTTDGVVGTFPRGTVFKCFEEYNVTVNNVPQRERSSTLTCTILGNVNIRDKVNLYSSGSAKYMRIWPIDGIAYGTCYITFDGSDPRTNGIEWDAQCLANYETNYFYPNSNEDYVAKCCLKYGDSVSDILTFTCGKGENVTVESPDINVSNTGLITIQSKGTATTIYNEDKAIRKDSIGTWNTINSSFYTSYILLLCRSYRRIPAAPKGSDKVKIYSPIKYVTKPVNAPTITLDSQNNQVVISTETNLTTYYKIEAARIQSGFSVYNEPISVDDCIGKQVQAYNAFNYDDEITVNIDSEVTVFDAPSNELLEAPVIDVLGGKVRMRNLNGSGIIYYTVDGSVPTTSSEQYESPVYFGEDCTIKAKVISDTLVSPIATFDYNYDENNPSKPYIKHTDGENRSLNTSTVRAYIDIIFNGNYEISKVINSISYIINEINDEIPAWNPVEEDLERRYSGDAALIYSDECNSGLLNIAQPSIINAANNYKIPAWDKGVWNWNYFRHKITTALNDTELNGYATFPYYNPKTRKNETKRIALDKLKQANAYSKSDRTMGVSDNRSLIYGKYFVIRFIFDNNKRIKLENVSINTQNY